MRAFVGLGANLGDRLGAIRAALATLDALPGSRLAAVSSLYRSTPVDAGGPDYFNAAAALDTGLGPEALLAALQDIENAQGRERPYHHAPRTLDLDLLAHGDAQRATPALSLPHPRLQQRAFVLRPLLEIAPALALAGLGPLDLYLPQVATQRTWRLPQRLDLRLRPLGEDDVETVVQEWHAVNRRAHAYVAEIRRHSLDDDRRFFRATLMADCLVTLASDLDGRPLGFSAIEIDRAAGAWMRQLAVFDGQRRHGVGGLLVADAQARWPRGLRLHTFQRNLAARAFYGRLGFEELRLGISPAPESEPDVLLGWPRGAWLASAR